MFAEKVDGAIEFGVGRGGLGRRAETEALIADAHTDGIGWQGQVVFDDGEAAVLGVGGVGGIEGPDDAGGLGYGGGTQEAVDGEAAVGVEGDAFAQVVGEEDGLAADAGDVGEGGEELVRGDAVTAGGAEAARLSRPRKLSRTTRRTSSRRARRRRVWECRGSSSVKL